MSRELRIIVPRVVDAANTNAQNLNARALLSRFRSEHARWITAHYDEPDQTVVGAPRTEVRKLWRTRLWQWRMLLLYQQSADAIFYPGMDWFDARALALRKQTGRRVPVIGTIEGLVGDDERERLLENAVGHELVCHRVPRETLDRIDFILRSCDHIIAITPMLEKIARELYGDKVSLLPLGIDGSIFNGRWGRVQSSRPRVITVATLTERKRPFVLIEIAKIYPEIDFVWFGTGPLLSELRRACTDNNLANISFPGGLLPNDLAEEYRRSDVFALPSLSEGAPKALQEAAACGLPRVAFGHYEPAITDSKDGYVVWSDDEFAKRIKDACDRRCEFRTEATTERDIDWGVIAPRWEQELISRLESLI